MRFSFLIWFVPLFLQQCQSASDKIEPVLLRHAFESKDADVRQIVERFRALPKPRPGQGIDYSNDWIFKDGSDSFLISIPHKFITPDHDAWYERRVHLHRAGAFHIRADDGAQVFISGRRIRSEGTLFHAADTGHVVLSIRVMNNAMTGGLRRVSFLSKEDVHEYRKEADVYRRLFRLISKIERLPNPARTLLDKMSKAIDDPVEENIAGAERALEDVPFLIGPFILQRDAHSVKVGMITDADATVEIYWTNSDGRGFEKTTGRGPVVFFDIKASPSDTINYFVQIGDYQVPLTSVAAATENFSFNIWADSQAGWKDFLVNMTNTSLFDDSFGIGAGDLVGNGYNELEWWEFLKILSIDAHEKPYFLVPGNHDYDGYYDSLVSANFEMLTPYATSPYHSWTYGNCAFIALDPNNTFPIGIATRSEQYRWLMRELEGDGWRNATWRFIVIHQPPYSQGWEGYHGDKVLRDLLEPLAERHRIDFILSGHTHDYERLTRLYGKQKTTFIIAGGAGGEIEPRSSSKYPVMDTVIKTHHIGRFHIHGSKVSFTVRDKSNILLDSIQFLKSDAAPSNVREEFMAEEQ